jgi:hypothetical protein
MRSLWRRMKELFAGGGGADMRTHRRIEKAVAVQRARKPQPTGWLETAWPDGAPDIPTTVSSCSHEGLTSFGVRLRRWHPLRGWED